MLACDDRIFQLDCQQKLTRTRRSICDAKIDTYVIYTYCIIALCKNIHKRKFVHIAYAAYIYKYRYVCTCSDDTSVPGDGCGVV